MLIYAHRGGAGEFPEGSLQAYLGAIKAGSDGFECDLRLTKDEQIICYHDPTTKRLSKLDLKIANTTLAQLKEQVDPLGFVELLELAIANKKDLVIEFKHPVPTGSAVEKKVMELLHQEKQVAQISVMSFSWLALENIRKIDPEQQTVALLHDKFSFAMRRFTSAHAIGPGINAFRKKPQLNQDPRKLFVWTVDSADDMRFCADNGVDVLITNTPSYARSVLGYN